MGCKETPIYRFLVWENWTDGTLKGLVDDIFAGLTVAMAQVPQAIAFSVIAKMPPMYGLYASFYLSLIMAIIGGRSGAIYGAAGALAVVYPELNEHYGNGAVLAATIFSGALCILPGLFRVSDYIRLIPSSVMIGFVDGLAIVIFIGTLSNFQDANKQWITGLQAFYTVLLMFITLAVIWLLPLLTKAVPSTIVAVVIGTACEYIFQFGTVTVGDKYDAQGVLVAPSIPDIKWEDSATMGEVWKFAFIVAIIAAVESLMTQILLDRENKDKSSMDREMVTFGIAQVINGFLGGMGGCALVGPTILNLVSGGGKRRLSGTINGIMTLICILAAAPAIGIIPLGPLSAVTFTICIRTFDWETFRNLIRIPYSDSLVVLTVTVVTIFTDLAIGVAAGIGVALIFLAFTLRECVKMTMSDTPRTVDASDWYADMTIVDVQFSGLLFFASAPKWMLDMELEILPKLVELKATDVVLNLRHCQVQDFGGIDALAQIGTLFSQSKIRIHVADIETSAYAFRRASPLLLRSIMPWEKDAENRVTMRWVAPKIAAAKCYNKEVPRVKAPFPHHIHMAADERGIAGTTFHWLPMEQIHAPVHLVYPVADISDSELREVTASPQPDTQLLASKEGETKQNHTTASNEPINEGGNADATDATSNGEEKEKKMSREHSRQHSDVSADGRAETVEGSPAVDRDEGFPAKEEDAKEEDKGEGPRSLNNSVRGKTSAAGSAHGSANGVVATAGGDGVVAASCVAVQERNLVWDGSVTDAVDGKLATPVERDAAENAVKAHLKCVLTTQVLSFGTKLYEN